MGVFPSIVTFLILWWTVLFVVLPLGLSTRSGPDDVVVGADAGAPATVNMPKKFLLTTAIAAALWLVLFTIASFGLFDLETLAFDRLARGD